MKCIRLRIMGVVCIVGIVSCLIYSDNTLARRIKDISPDVSVVDALGFFAKVGMALEEWQIKRRYKVEIEPLVEKYGEDNKKVLLDTILTFAQSLQEAGGNPKYVVNDIIYMLNPLAHNIQEFRRMLLTPAILKNAKGYYRKWEGIKPIYCKDLSVIETAMVCADNADEFITNLNLLIEEGYYYDPPLELAKMLRDRGTPELFREILNIPLTMNISRAILSSKIQYILDIPNGLKELKRFINNTSRRGHHTVERLFELAELARENPDLFGRVIDMAIYWDSKGADLFNPIWDKNFGQFHTDHLFSVVTQITSQIKSEEQFHLINDLLIAISNSGVIPWTVSDFNRRSRRLLEYEYFGPESHFSHVMELADKFPETFELLIQMGIKMAREKAFHKGKATHEEKATIVNIDERIDRFFEGVELYLNSDNIRMLLMRNNEAINSFLYTQLKSYVEYSDDFRSLQLLENGIEALQKVFTIGDERFRLAIKLGQKVIEKGHPLEVLFTQAIPSLANLDIDRYRRAVELGLHLEDEGIGPCFCLLYLVPIVDKSSADLEEFNRHMARLEKVIINMKKNNPYPGYTIKYIVPIIGNLANNIEEVERIFGKITHLFIKIKEWRSSQSSKLELELKKLATLTSEEYAEIRRYIESEHDEGITGRLVGDWSFYTKPQDVELESIFKEIIEGELIRNISYAVKLSSNLDTFLNAIDLEIRLFESRFLTEDKTIKIPFDIIVTWHSDAYCTQLKQDGLDAIQKMKGEKDHYIEYIERRIENVEYYNPLTVAIAKAVNNDSREFSIWVNRLKVLSDRETLEICADNVGILAEYFRNRSVEEWLIFVEKMSDYVGKNHPVDFILTNEFIDNLLTSSFEN